MYNSKPYWEAVFECWERDKERNSVVLRNIKTPINKFNPHNIKEVIFNPPATIVYFTDGSKTVVKTKEGEEFNPEVGFAMAMMREIFGSRGAYKRFIEEQKFVEKKIKSKKDDDYEGWDTVDIY